MNITRTSAFSGVTRTVDLPVTPEQVAAWQNGELAQNAFPGCDASQREFIMTGVTAEEWEATMGSGDEEDDEEDETCLDCTLTFDDCECGTDPDEYDSYDDGEALASAGHGTDKDYGGMIGGDSDLMGEW